ncbi:helix-turn-helix transcriptional regulator, partial [Streptomyces stramineus]|uniref:helix-turn-helix domain-containing protein n=1 Tax=Streptomyces stramineus TaxID=173861 RepID=UPI0031DC7DB4
AAPPPRPPQAPRPAPPPPASAEGDEALAEIAGDMQEELRQLLRTLTTADSDDLLRRAARVRTQLDGLTAGLVGRGRCRRMTWSRVGHILGISEDTARHRYTDSYILRRLGELTRLRTAPTSLSAIYAERHAVRRKPAPRRGGPPVNAPRPKLPTRPRPAYNRLAPVLSMLARASKLSLKDLSRRTRCSASYLSRVLSGERTPTWELTERFAHACGADPGILRTVWETERLRGGTTGPPVELDEGGGDDGDPVRAAARLLTALRTLHVRAGQPTAYDIATAGKWQLSLEQITPILEGTQLPDWPDLASLLHVLGGDIGYFESLWEAAVRPPGPPPG